MVRWRLLPLVLLPLILCSSCFRATSFHPHEVQQLRLDQGSATVVYKNGDSRRIAHFDSLTVETNAPPPEARPVARTWSEDQSLFEFDHTTRGSLAAPRLQLEDQRGPRIFPLARVERITLENYSPERPWLILAAASVGAVVGGLVGYSMGAPCNEEWGCMEKGLYAMAGVPIGLGIGLALSIPLTRPLGTLYPAPTGPEAPKGH